jgi:hypothetical protein
VKERLLHHMSAAADLLRLEEVGTASWHSRDAELEEKLAKVVKRLDKHMGGTLAERKVSKT